MKLELGTEVIINNKAPINRDDAVSFMASMMSQLGKRGKIIKRIKRNSTYIYMIRTEDDKQWWYMPEWFHEAVIYTGF